MTHLLVNLNDPQDCRSAIAQLREILRRDRCAPPGGDRDKPGRGRHDATLSEGFAASGADHGDPAALPENNERGPSLQDDLIRSRRPRRPGTDRREDLHSLPLPKKLNRISQRGVFRHLNRIAHEVHTPMSLPELDRHLGLQPNKMRSLKAIMAKLENRFDLRFLILDPEGAQDESGNPRYIMPPRLRNQIRAVASRTDAT